jgi:hypothetical protein
MRGTNVWLTLSPPQSSYHQTSANVITLFPEEPLFPHWAQMSSMNFGEAYHEYGPFSHNKEVGVVRDDTDLRLRAQGRAPFLPTTTIPQLISFSHRGVRRHRDDANVATHGSLF